MLYDESFYTEDNELIRVVCFTIWPCPYIIKYADNLKSANALVKQCEKWSIDKIKEELEIDSREAKEARFEVRCNKMKRRNKPTEKEIKE